MIDDNIKIHDRFQFEIKLGYGLDSNKKRNEYSIDSYFFLPNNLGVNEDTYSKNDFYSDLQIYLRFKTPQYYLGQIAEKGNPLFKNLEYSMINLVKKRSTSSIQSYKDNIKLFCCILKAAFRDHINYLFTRTVIQDDEILVDNMIIFSEKISLEFRNLRRLLTVPDMDDRLFSIYLFADEYLSLLKEQYCFKIITILNKHRNYDTSPLIKRIRDCIAWEISYRKENAYPSIVKADTDNEDFIYRSSVLKKYMSNILFLDIQRRSGNKYLEHFFFSISAGLAMVVATAIAFYSKVSFGDISLPFFIILVVSYMLKDRIKEISRQFFSSLMSRFICDQKVNIFYVPGQNLGVCKESMDFMELQNLPKEILKLRNFDHLTEIENGWVGQDVIRYKRHIQLFEKKIKNSLLNYDVDSVNDIIRFDISKFINKMDNPDKKLFYLNNNSIEIIPADRTYHLNLVIKYTINKKEYLYKRFRIIMNRNGIKRLEEVGTVTP